MSANVSGYLSINFWTSVPFPTPDGPEIMIGLRSIGAAWVEG